MPIKETFTSRFGETRGGKVPQKSKIWGDVFYGWSLRSHNPKKDNYLTFLIYIVSAETIHLEIVANLKSLLNKLNFCCGNYSREETGQGWKLYEEIRY